ncbi:hypothetical protein ACE193_09890 [Bernardetia sp. OM2101]|uniref:hypothetical protein n=1 Tax=Bernardetia sp. OM2101 TaxID=3344876 RepID=UPI0035D0B3BA
MKKYNAIYLIILICFLITSCDFSPKNRGENKNHPYLTPKETWEEKYQWEKVYVEGIVSMPSEQTLGVLGIKSDSYDIILTHESGEVYPEVKINIGDTLNHMKPIPKSYTKDDLVIQDKNGKAIRVGDKVRVRGTINQGTHTNYDTNEEKKDCFISIGRIGEIEKL